jgi:predicted metalloprotease with PDZ domain
MDYAKDLENISVKGSGGMDIPLVRTGTNRWQLLGVAGQDLVISYEIATHRRFVATSYTDSAFAYILPASTFIYVDGFTNHLIGVKVVPREGWDQIATGLSTRTDADDLFYAPGYDILIDCPILVGNLEEFPPFKVEGITHRFIAHDPGELDQEQLMGDLQRFIQVAADMMGEVPYDQYTFIGLGKGLGGIEHLNNTTISFHGSSLATPESRKGVLAFIAHEYFHHYNVKRIRPIELGPFDYERENRTNQLWVSEGLTVYYEYLLLRRAGLIGEKELLRFLAGDINAYENDQGKDDQSLREASYYTWEEGPFGTRGGASDQSISYYEKGSILGMLLDFQIRDATGNTHSLDDVMRLLYRKYYKELQRGFSEAEFQQACESIAGIPLSDLFEYVYTTREIDYQTYLGMAGLQLNKQPGGDTPGGRVAYTIIRMPESDEFQQKIVQAWQEHVTPESYTSRELIP